MKKLLCFAIGMLLASSTLFCGCLEPIPSTGTGSGDPTPEPPALTKEEEMALTDKEYDRAIYLTEGTTYSLIKQYEYEKYTTTGVEFVADTTTAFTLENGVITANTTEDATDAVITANFADKTEKIIVHVLDNEKYGSRISTVDAGLLYGKNVLFFGDSITHNWARFPDGNKESDNGSNSLGYNHIPMLNEVCNFASIVNAGWSGGTVSYVPSSKERFTYKSFPGGVDAHVEDIKNADVIFVWYGTNDLTEQYSIGNSTDVMTTDEKTDYGFWAGLNYSYSKIKAANPNATIIVMDIMTRDPMNYGSIKMSDYNNAIAEAAEKYNAKLFKVSKLFYTRDLPTYTQDSLHPNEAGYKVVTEYILLKNKTARR